MEKKYSSDWNRAKSFLAAAEANLKLDDFKTAANREYFACERAVVAVLKLKGIRAPSVHKKIWEKSALVEQNSIHLLRSLYDLRLQADYGKSSFIVPLNMQTAEEYLEKVKSFIALLEKKYKMD